LSSLRAFALAVFLFLVLPGVAAAQSTGGARFVAPAAATPASGDITVPGKRARLLPDGTAAAPAAAPAEVREAVWAANRLQDKPYRYGGGHARVEDPGYDC